MKAIFMKNNRSILGWHLPEKQQYARYCKMRPWILVLSLPVTAYILLVVSKIEGTYFLLLAPLFFTLF
jgi:hypothetical protein